MLLMCSSLDPPEMNTNQLLLVSTLGLVINLFGMVSNGRPMHTTDIRIAMDMGTPTITDTVIMITPMITPMVQTVSTSMTIPMIM